MDCGSPNVAEYVRELIARDLGKGRLPLDSYLLLRCMLAVDYKLTATLKSGGLSRETLDQIRYEAEEHSKNLTDLYLERMLNPDSQMAS